MARFAPLRRIHLLPCLLCLLLVATAALDFPELEDDMTPTVFQIEAEDGQVEVQDEADREAEAEPDLEDGVREQLDSFSVQKMEDPEQQMDVVAEVERERDVSGRMGASDRPQTLQPSLKDRLVSLRQLPLRRRASETGCSSNPTVCLDPSYYAAGPTCCAGKCVNTDYDDNNCGFCGNTCQLGTTCCVGLCIDTQSDSSNCGKCANVCPSGETCAFGFCGYGYS